MPSNEPDVLIRMVHCPKTGIITCHGFSYDPFTSNRGLTQILKSYRKDHCYLYEDVHQQLNPDTALLYKCNEHTSKNGSIKIPFNSVFLRRNVKTIKQAVKKRKRDAKTDNKQADNSNEIFVSSAMSYQICHKTLSMKFKQGEEDILVRKRAKVDEEEEFQSDLLKAIKVRALFNDNKI